MSTAVPQEVSQDSDDKAKPKQRRPLFRNPLALTAVCLAVIASIGNYLIGGGYPEIYGLDECRKMPKSKLATLETQLQLRIAKEQILRPTGQVLSSALASLGFLKLHQGNKKEAIRLFEKSIANQDYGQYNDPVRYHLARLYLSAGRTDEAVTLMVKWRALLDRINRDATEDMVAFHQLDEIVMRAAGKENAANQAKALGERCLRTPLYLSFSSDNKYAPSPSTLHALFEEGCSLLVTDKYAESKRVLNMVIKGLPDIGEDLQSKRDAILMLPVVDYCAGDWDAADKDFAAAALQPIDESNTATVVFYHYYSEYLRRKGLKAKADEYAAKEMAWRKQRHGYYITGI